MKKILLLLAFTLPLTAQQTETDKEITKQEQREKRSDIVRTMQDWDFRKYEAAHSRAHAKMSKNPQKYRREQMSRRKKSGQWIRNIVIGGVVWYVGYEMGKDEMKKGRKKGKRPIWMPDREKK